jgi:hypothetical protein
MEFLQAKKTDFFPLSENDFVFRIKNESEFFDLKKRILFFNDFIFYIKNNKIFISKINLDLVEILKRIIGKNYDKISGFFSEKFETKLNEDQIFNINNIIKSAHNFFNLETEIESNFLIKKFEKSEENIFVDFDLEKEKLEIKILLDYGCKKFNITETVFTKIISGNTIFSRRANSFYGYKYIFDILGKNISYAEVDHNKEIELYKHILSFSGELGFNKNLILNKKGARQINHFIENN